VKKLGIFFFLDFHIPLEAMHLHLFPFWSDTKRVSTIRNRVLRYLQRFRHTLLSSVDDDGIWGTEKKIWEATSTSGTRHPEMTGNIASCYRMQQAGQEMLNILHIPVSSSERVHGH
jgi:hypothetical protein